MSIYDHESVNQIVKSNNIISNYKKKRKNKKELLSGCRLPDHWSSKVAVEFFCSVFVFALNGMKCIDAQNVIEC